jgi:hypothetical protein
MNKKVIKNILLLIAVFFMIFTIFKHIWITNTVWEFERGYKVGQGDFIEFNSNMYSLKLNSVYRKGIKNSKIIKFNILNGELWLKDHKCDRIGIYVDRDNH